MKNKFEFLKFSFFLIVILMLSLALSVQSQTIGNTFEGDSFHYPGIRLNAVRYQASQNMTVDKMYAKIGHAASGSVKCAIYADNSGVPGAFLRGTNELTNQGTGWKSFNLTSGLALTSGTWYQLTVWPGDNNYAFYYNSGGVGTSYSGTLTYGTWPSSFGTTNLWDPNITYCIYATVTCTNPAITAQPQGLTKTVGQSASFTVTASGTSLSYQWKKGATNVGTSSSTYTIASVVTGDAGNYSVVVSGACGSAATSSTAVLIVNPSCTNPSITGQPQSITRSVGQSASFTVTASGTSLSYQWKKGATNVGTSSSTYTIASVVTGDAGNYSVVVSGACGSPATSSTAVLTVGSTVTIGNTSEGDSFYYLGIRMTAVRYQASQNMTVDKMYAKIGHAASGNIKCAIYADNSGVPGAFLRGTNELTNLGTGWQSFNLTSGLALTSGTWYHLTVWAGDNNYAFYYTNGGIGTLYSATGYGTWPDPFGTTTLWTTGTFCIYAQGTTGGCTNPSITGQPQGLTKTVGQSASFTVTASGTSLSYQWKKGATNVGTSSSTYTIASVVTGDAGNYTVVVSGACGSPATSSTAVLTVNPSCTNPSITGQPQGLTKTVGESASFSVTATGTSLSYQWTQAGTNMSGKTASTFTIASVTHGDEDDYGVVVSGACGSPATSNTVHLAVNTSCTNPAITAQPQSITKTVGQSATFTVTASGTSLSYQWKKGATNVGTSSSTYTIASVVTGDAGNYSVVVSGACGSPATSSTAVLTVGGTTADYYVSPSGSDSNPGTLSQPFFTLNKAWTVVSAGKLVYMRGGTYYYTNEQALTDKDGTSGSLISILAYPGEHPVIDYNGATSPYFAVRLRNADYIYMKGIRVTNLLQPSNPTSGMYGLILWDDVNHCTFELMETDHIGGWGVVIGSNSSNNLFLNCDSHHNSDPIGDLAYGGADGFETGSNGSITSTNIIFRGCRAWSNSDDGWDLRQADGIYTIENCWAFRNGYREDGVTEGGNGEGFKLGGKTSPPTNNILRTITNSIAFENRTAGFTPEPDDANSILGVAIYNCTAYKNSQSGDGDGISTGNYSNYTIVKNCIAYYNNGRDANMQTGSVHDHNNFDIPITVTDADFLSVSSTGMDGARQADGSLPNLNFLHLNLSPISNLVGAGTVISGIPYTGPHPDLGAFESSDVTKSAEVNVTGNAGLDQQDQVSVYPNPVNGILNISANGGVKEMSLKLYDIRGIELYGSVKTGDCKLDMGKYQSGIYFLKIICGGKTDIRKIMKN